MPNLLDLLKSAYRDRVPLGLRIPADTAYRYYVQGVPAESQPPIDRSFLSQAELNTLTSLVAEAGLRQQDYAKRAPGAAERFKMHPSVGQDDYEALAKYGKTGSTISPNAAMPYINNAEMLGTEGLGSTMGFLPNWIAALVPLSAPDIEGVGATFPVVEAVGGDTGVAGSEVIHRLRSRYRPEPTNLRTSFQRFSFEPGANNTLTVHDQWDWPLNSYKSTAGQLRSVGVENPSWYNYLTPGMALRRLGELIAPQGHGRRVEIKDVPNPLPKRISKGFGYEEARRTREGGT